MRVYGATLRLSGHFVFLTFQAPTLMCAHLRFSSCACIFAKFYMRSAGFVSFVPVQDRRRRQVRKRRLGGRACARVDARQKSTSFRIPFGGGLRWIRGLIRFAQSVNSNSMSSPFRSAARQHLHRRGQHKKNLNEPLAPRCGASHREPGFGQ